MYHAGLMPERTDDPEDAFRLWTRDGAAILTTGRTDAEAMLEGVLAVFGDRLSAHQGFSRVSSNRTPGEDTYFDPATRTVHANAGVRLELHIDGYMAFGDCYPDLLFLLCERQASSGGESFLVDGRRLVEAIANDPDQESLNRFLWDVTLEQSRPEGSGPSGTSQPIPHRRPVVSRTSTGRLTVRFHEHQRPLDDRPRRDEDLEHLSRWRDIVNEEANAAPRFLLRPGDLFCIDNYRVFHGREPYGGFDRLLHKLWAWSDMSFGIPDRGDLVSRGRQLVVMEGAR